MPHSADNNPSIDTGLHCLVLLARFHGLPADPDHLNHQFAEPGKPFTSTEILRAGRALGLKARAVQSRWDRLAQTALPAIARHKDGHWFVAGQIADGKVLIQDPLERRPLALPRGLFEQAWSGELILITRRASLSNGGGRFGIGWFIPALLKYRRLFAEVLAASFFLQLFALVTPLFFQVVIDKVLVHKGLTTLDVLAIGLLLVSLFEVILGAQLYQHLLSLPIAYFEARRVGDSVARVRELENIRNFLTGSALTVVIDLFFTLVFFGVMYYHSPALTFVVLGAIPLYGLLSLGVTPLLRRRLDDKFNRGAENQSFLVESVSGIQTLKAMAVEPQMQRRWEEQLAGYVQAGFKAATLGNIVEDGKHDDLIRQQGHYARLHALQVGAG